MEESLDRKPAHWLNGRKFFYKYMSAETGRIVLENGTLRWSKPNKLNDPFDLQFDLPLLVDRKEAERETLQKLWESIYLGAPLDISNQMGLVITAFRDNFPKLSFERFRSEFSGVFDECVGRLEKSLPAFRQEFQKHLSMAKVLCLTEDESNILMWSHYADSHRGLVVRLRSIPETDSAWGAARQVQYESAFPSLMTRSLMADILAGQGTLKPAHVLDKVIYTKSMDWSYEKEWRICIGYGRNAAADVEDHTFHPLELDGIFFGARMSNAVCQSLTNLARQKYPHAVLSQMQTSSQGFKLQAVPFM